MRKEIADPLRMDKDKLGKELSASVRSSAEDILTIQSPQVTIDEKILEVDDGHMRVEQLKRRTRSVNQNAPYC